MRKNCLPSDGLLASQIHGGKHDVNVHDEQKFSKVSSCNMFREIIGLITYGGSPFPKQHVSRVSIHN